MNGTTDPGRLAVAVHRGNATIAALAFGGATAIWVWLAAAALTAGSLSHLLVLPVALAGALGFGWLTVWAVRRRSLEEPALVVDAVGLFDNVAPMRVGRIRWNEIDRAWMIGPKGCRILCILPTNPDDLIGRQDGMRAWGLRASAAMSGAPILIPVAMLDLDPDQLWEEVACRFGEAPRVGPSTVRLVPGQ